MTKQNEVVTTPLKIVGHQEKEWKTFDAEFGEGYIMPFFSLKEGRYEMVYDGEYYSLDKVFAKPQGRQSIVLYPELVEQIKSGGSILVDEDILQI